MLQLLLNPVTIISIIISVALVIAPIFTIQEPETTVTQEPFSFETTEPLHVEQKTLLFFIPVTEAHQSITNTDNLTGTFKINFIFDNGREKKATLEEVTLIRNQQGIVSSTVYCLSGNVNVTANIIPPYKLVRHTKLVDKKVNLLECLKHLRRTGYSP